MSPQDFTHLKFIGPTAYDKDIVLYEALDDHHKNQENWIYSCVALCRKNWREADWPALGGTRRLQVETGNWANVQSAVRKEAAGLATSMYIKNRLLRHAELCFESQSMGLFGWQGGKGVIWTPKTADSRKEHLSPYRLMCHGRLVNHLGGQYFASKDVGVGTLQLSWINRSTHYNIGLGCGKDTGEATAQGVLSGLIQACKELDENSHVTDDQVLKNRTILVAGVGKVGLPLLSMLDNRGANLLVFDKYLKCDVTQVKTFFDKVKSLGGAVGESHLHLLNRLVEEKRIFDREMDALGNRDYEIFSPNGGMTGYLSKEVDETGKSRAAILAETAKNGGKLRLILGAGNDQITTLPDRAEERDRTLRELRSGGVLFVPDTLVSPGGVIAVSHELSPPWDSGAVNDDAYRMVQQSVRTLFEWTRNAGSIDSVALYQTFEKMIDSEWQ